MEPFLTRGPQAVLVVAIVHPVFTAPLDPRVTIHPQEDVQVRHLFAGIWTIVVFCFCWFSFFFFPLQLAVTGQGVPPIIFAVASAMQDVTVSQDPIKPVRQNVPPVRTETVAAPMLHATVIVRPVIIAHKKQVLPLKSNAVGINIIAPAVLNPPLMYPRGIMPPVAVHKRGPALKFVQRGLTVPVVS